MSLSWTDYYPSIQKLLDVVVTIIAAEHIQIAKQNILTPINRKGILS